VYFPNFSDVGSFEGPKAFTDAKLGDWPDATDVPSTAFAFNFGTFYAAPQVAISSIFDLRTANGPTDDDIGEPVFYAWNGTTHSFEVYTSSSLDVTDPPALFVKIKDVTLGGAIDINNFPMDDESEQYWLNFWVDDSIASNGKWDYTDSNGDGVYDDGEGVESINVEIDVAVDGLIDASSVATDYSNDVAAYYAAGSIDDIPDSVLIEIVAGGTAADVAFLRSYLNYDDEALDLEASPIFILDGNAVYFIPPQDEETVAVFATGALHSLTNEGDTITVIDTENGGTTNGTSTGSFWWGIVDFMLTSMSN
jgi:hypothetical protein